MSDLSWERRDTPRAQTNVDRLVLVIVAGPRNCARDISLRSYCECQPVRLTKGEEVPSSQRATATVFGWA